MADDNRLILASGSPRRQQLMRLLKVPFEVRVPEVDEQALLGEIPAELPQRFSRLKAEWVAREVSQGIVVAADTVVVHKGDILGKPRDASHARAMLCRLRGERHRVLSGVTVIDVPTGEEITELCESLVWLRHMDDHEIEKYIASGDPLDKAAAYAVQNTQFAPVEQVVGCPANVMGLPMCHVVRNLWRLGAVLPSTLPTRCEIRYGYRCALTSYVMPGMERVQRFRAGQGRFTG
jgi:septum formation protein